MNDKVSFLGLIANRVIRIPRIQRDYAEGRETEKIRAIRRTFLNSLLRVVFSEEKTSLELDFVYGYYRNGAFEPLDGQQRLTTLFLLHWFFCPANNGDLRHVEGGLSRSRFTYETRISSEEFCNEIILHNAESLLKKAGGKITFSSAIKSRDWFKWGWRRDPSVVSMLVVLDEIVDLMSEHGYEYSTDRYERLNQITFNVLDLRDFDLGDDLYVKMNARGKQLSEFDILKSTLEEEIQHQIEDARKSDEAGLTNGRLATMKSIERDWPRLMDSDWIDYFWQKRNVRGDGTVDVLEVEHRFLRLLVRLISLQYLSSKAADGKLAVLANETDEASLERLISVYFAEAWKARKNHVADFQYIDFARLMSDMSALIVPLKESDGRTVWHDFTDLIDEGFFWSQDIPSVSIFDLYLGVSFSRPVHVGFYSVLAFLRKCSRDEIKTGLMACANSDTPGSNALVTDFNEWVRFVRNCTILENTSNRIDKPAKAIQAMKLLEDWAGKFFEPKAKSAGMLAFIRDLTHAPGLENERIDEEALKARLRMMDPDWTNKFVAAENDPYLIGQVISPLSWSRKDDGYDKTLFEKYVNYLSRIFGSQQQRDDKAHVKSLYSALFASSDYRFGRNRDNAGMFTFDRDVSWKRYMRERTAAAGGVYAPVLKHFIDEWIEQYDDITLEDVSVKMVNAKQETVNDWRKYLLRCPELLVDFAPYAIVASKDGHAFLVRGRTSNSRGVEVFTAYLYGRAEGDQKRLVDSIAPHGERNSVEFKVGGKTYKVQATADGRYTLTVNGNEIAGVTDASILQTIGWAL